MNQDNLVDMVVNSGGFVGPVVAGLVRNELGWSWVDVEPDGIAPAL